MKTVHYVCAALCGLLLISHISVAQAQVPPLINHQGQLLDNEGKPANGDYSMVFSIYNVATGGSALYRESRKVTVRGGVYNIFIGSVTPIPQDLFDEPPHERYLEVTVNETVLTPRRQFGSVPYAFNARGSSITAVNAGPGLEGGGTSGEILLSIAESGVESVHILDGTITSDDLGPNSVGSEEIVQGSVTSTHLANNAITRSKIRSRAVGSDELDDAISFGRAGVADGQLQFITDENERAIELDVNPTTKLGRIRVFNEDGTSVVTLTSRTNGAGYADFSGPNSEPNARISTLSGFPNHGFIHVFDAGGNSQAGMYVNSSGQGVVFADIKNFRMDHPTAPDMEIWYASIEGPEAAAYLRGTGQLIDGKAEITFPEHFQIVASDEGMTVYITPADISSLGLAVTSKSTTGITVQELYQGKGNYAFDWEVKSVRKGYENYRVLRRADETEQTRDDGLAGSEN